MKQAKNLQRSTNGKRLETVFNFFIAECQEAFQYLLSEYGFTGPDVTIDPPECCLTYRSNYLEVDVCCEYPGLPWTILRAILSQQPRTVETYGLHLLIREKCPDHLLDYKKISRSNENMRLLLQHYAKELEWCGRDILRGDFSILPQLKAQYELVARNRSR